MFIPDYNARKSLASKLNLEFHEDMQDWEYEISDYKRISDFIEEYDKIGTSDNEKKSLMEIIIDSANDLIFEERIADFEQCYGKIKERLLQNSELHASTLKYWTDNDFPISKKLII